MGHFIPIPPEQDAVAYLRWRFNAEEIRGLHAWEIVGDERFGVVVLIEDPGRMLAVFAFDREEFARLHEPSDTRPRLYLRMDPIDAAWFSGMLDSPDTPLTIGGSDRMGNHTPPWERSEP